MLKSHKLLITGNILHESSSAPRQHKSVQYKWFALHLHRDVSHTDMLQPHFISCRGVSGAGGNMRGSRIFFRFIKSSAYFILYRAGPMVLLLRKLYLYFTKDPEKSIIFQGGGCPTLSRGVQMLISIETHIRTCDFPGGGCPDPISPSGSANGQCHHNGTIFITVPLLTIIVRHHIDLSGLMTGEVFQMMHWYCARLTPSRNTALGNGSFCNSAFFSLQNINYLSAVSRTISATG